MTGGREERAGSRGIVPLAAAILTFALAQTAPIPALPQIQSDLHASPAEASWVLSAFLLTAAVSTVVFGKVGDMVGKKRILLFSLGIVALGTLLSAFAPSIWFLVVARALQGLGAAILPLSFGIVRDEFAAARVPHAIGTLSATFGVGFAIGLIVPGPIIEAFGWAWIFVVLSLATITAAAMIALRIPESPDLTPDRIDWVGAVLLAAAAAPLLLAISQFSRWPPAVLALLLVVAGGAGALFVRVELRTRAPLVDIVGMRNPPLMSANIASLFTGFATFSVFTLVPQLAQTPAEYGLGFGLSVTQSGLILLPMALAMLVAGPVAGRLGVRLGFKTVLVLACAIGAGGYLLLALGRGELWLLSLGVGVVGIGIGFAFSALTTLVVVGARADTTSQALGVSTLLRTIGSAIGAQVAAAVITSQLVPGTSVPASGGYGVAFALAGAALLIAAVIAAVLPATSEPRSGG